MCDHYGTYFSRYFPRNTTATWSIFVLLLFLLLRCFFSGSLQNLQGQLGNPGNLPHIIAPRFSNSRQSPCDFFDMTDCPFSFCKLSASRTNHFSELLSAFKSERQINSTKRQPKSTIREDMGKLKTQVQSLSNTHLIQQFNGLLFTQTIVLCFRLCLKFLARLVP